MPAGKITKIKTITHPSYRNTGKYKKRYGRKRWGYISRVPRAGFRRAKSGGAPIIVPLKCAYQTVLSGTVSPALNIDLNATLASMPNPDWFSRYYPMFQLCRINKVKFKIICPYNIGQANVGRATTYKIWSKRATVIGETPPGTETEWLNMQNAKQKLFNTKSMSQTYYFTPFFEAPQGATTAKRLMYKQWFEMPNGPTQCIEHGGMIASIMSVDGKNIEATEKFTIQVTLYCQFKGLKQL